MRRSGHPSRPRAITCCFFASLKTLLISTKATRLTPKSTSRTSFSLAGFQVTVIGRFWVTAGELMRAEGVNDSSAYELDHLIPLELGGCPDCKENLWLEPYDPQPGARQKD